MKKVLILESNETFAKELSEYFEREGYAVCGVSGDGAEGLSLLEKNAPNVVVTSLLLTGVDGFTVMERAKKEGIKADFIVLGNFADDKIINRAIALGARYYLMKPVSAQVVEERVAEISSDETLPAREKFERRRASSLDERISNIFISIGIPPNIKGYSYLREGIKMAVADPNIINNVTKGLYPVIGEKYATTASKVERAIRHAIEVAWNRGRIDAVNFGEHGVRNYLQSWRSSRKSMYILQSCTYFNNHVYNSIKRLYHGHGAPLFLFAADMVDTDFCCAHPIP